MKRGRPPKHSLTPRWDERRKRWRVDVPASWTGRRVSMFFESESGAVVWAAKREIELAEGRALQFRETPARPVSTLVAMYLDEHKGAGLHALQNHLAKFCERFGGEDLNDLRAYPVREWLLSLDLAPRTVWGVFSSCRSFARWAVRYEFAKSHPFDRIDGIAKGRPAKRILTPDEMVEILAAPMPDYVRAWVALGGFAGLRTEEVLRMDWSAVDFDAGEIHVSPEVIKQSSRGVRERYVAMLPAFLAACPRGQTGRIVPVSRNTYQCRVAELCVALGRSSWPHNALRHSFASYHLATCEDAGKTAHQLGHTSTAMVFQNYARAVKKSEAERWWKIGCEK